MSWKFDPKTARPVRRRADILPGAELDRCITAILAGTQVPLGAYDIAAALRNSGRHAVVASIYRSLDRLRASGTVEKVETRSAFRIRDADRPILMICLRCGTVSSLSVPGQHAALERLVRKAGFTIHKMAIEVTGLCPDCARQALDG